MRDFPEYIDDLPNLCGREAEIQEAIDAARTTPVYPRSANLADIRATFAIALHMHQPLIPAGQHGPNGAEVISNLQWMMDHQDIHDNHNAPAFRWCYQRMGEIIPQLLSEGHSPRVMLEYSGTLLHGLRKMGAHDVIDSLKTITCEPKYRDAVEWIGCTWGHAVAPSTPVQDYRLHVRAWQHHFAAMFGLEALTRVRGFFPAEMALPNHPDVAYEFVKTLNDCGFQWVMVQEHTVELINGGPLEQRHLPHRLVCKNSTGQVAEIVAIIKTQGSDNKLVAQMQPYYEAKGLGRVTLAGQEVPQLVTQAADGENGGVMMNEFPPKYQEAIRECSGSPTPAMNVTEYLEQLFASGIVPADLPAVQPVGQHRIWEKMKPSKTGQKRLLDVIAKIKASDDRFHVDGGSWTNDISWVRGYDNVLAPMERASALFHDEMLAKGVASDDPRYRAALFHLLTAETSCFRYWGQGTWTDYGAELARMASTAVTGER